MSTFAPLTRRTSNSSARADGTAGARRQRTSTDEPQKLGSGLSWPIQAKLRVSAAHDPLEREADRIAEHVMSNRSSRVAGVRPAGDFVQSKCNECEDEDSLRVQRKASPVSMGPSVAGGAPSPGFAAELGQARAGGGRPLPPATRAFMESRLAADLVDVRVHDDARSAALARDIDARAFTVGRDVFFGRGEYRPQSYGGRKLLAHELAHTLQQGAAGRTEAPTIRRKIVVRPSTEDTYAGLAAIGTDREWAVTESHLRRFMLTNGKILGSGDRRRMVRKIYREIDASPAELHYYSYAELADDILSRVVITLLMQYSQGRGTSGFEYPDRSRTRGLGPRVNAAAQKYWGKVQGYKGADDPENYEIHLSKAGRQNAYAAIEALFTPQSGAGSRTLVHCDHLIAIIDLYTLAQKVGRAKFNQFVAAGDLDVRISRTAHHAIWISPVAKLMGDRRARKHNVTTSIPVDSEDEFLTGDHVVFYNHPSYPALNAVTRAPWKLENAIVVGGTGKGRLYQGHGFSGGVTRDKMIAAMMEYYNKLFDQAESLIKGGRFTTLAKRFPALSPRGAHPAGEVKRSRNTADWKLTFVPEGCEEKPKSMKLRELTAADYENTFAHPCTGLIQVNRPLESAAVHSPASEEGPEHGKAR